MKKIENLMNFSLENNQAVSVKSIIGGETGYAWKSTRGSSDEQLNTYDVNNGVSTNGRTDGDIYPC